MVRTQDGVLGSSQEQTDQMYTGSHGWLVKHGLVTSTVSIGHRFPSHGEEEDFLMADARAGAAKPQDEPYCKVRKCL